jgi:hypothetical protein
MDIAHPSLRRRFFKGNRFMEAGASSTTGERTDGWDASSRRNKRDEAHR